MTTMYQAVYSYGDAKINTISVERETEFFYFTVSGRRVPKGSHNSSVFGSFEEARDCLIRSIEEDISREIESHISTLKRKQALLDVSKNLSPILRKA